MQVFNNLVHNNSVKNWVRNQIFVSKLTMECRYKHDMQRKLILLFRLKATFVMARQSKPTNLTSQNKISWGPYFLICAIKFT